MRSDMDCLENEPEGRSCSADGYTSNPDFPAACKAVAESDQYSATKWGGEVSFLNAPKGCFLDAKASPTAIYFNTVGIPENAAPVGNDKAGKPFQTVDGHLEGEALEFSNWPMGVYRMCCNREEEKEEPSKK